MEQQQGFLDSKTIIAIVLVGLVWFGWQSYMTKKYPTPDKPNSEVTLQPKTAAPIPTAITTKTSADVPQKEQSLAYEDSVWSFSLSSLGMGLKDLTLKKFKDRKEDPIRLGSFSPHLTLATYMGSDLLQFQIVRTSEREFEGVANWNGTKIIKNIAVDSSNYLLLIKIKVAGQVSQPLNFVLSEESLEDVSAEGANRQGKNWETDPSIWQSYYISHGGTTEHQATSASSPLRKTYESVAVGSLNGKYFGQALVDDSTVLPSYKTDYDSSAHRYLGWLSYGLEGQKNIELQVKFFGGPKSLETLQSADLRLEKLANFGFFSWLAGPLLKLMKWLYEVTHNYGVAIILMTLLVRVAVMPFNLASYKSMKAMQVIQPQVNKLKEKYKDDPQSMNKEMMRLMKEHNANPLMGCLPMLLQLPVFFALYQVLDQSIELYKAPFIFWIHDLSLKDPFFVLPVLMGITMFVQQKITPTAMDPAQAKVLLMMPIVFAVFMATLPSGLTLYIFISTLFGIIQQFMFMREKRQTTPAIHAKA